jgi:protein-disulfide isomerase
VKSLLSEAVVAASVVLGTAAPLAAQPAAAPLSITAVDAGAATGTLTIAGANFGPRPLVTLDLVPLDVREVTPQSLVAAAPVSRMPPGRYLLTVSRGPEPTDTASHRLELHGGPAPPAATDPDAGQALLPAAGIAAVVGGQSITIAEVDREWLRMDPGGYLAAARRVHDARRRAAQRLVQDALVAREAVARNTTTDAVLAEEVPKRRIPLPDVAVASVYRSLGDRARGVSIEALQPAIRAWLAEVTEPELATLAYVEELMKVATKVEMRLTAPRVAVAATAADPSTGVPGAPVQLAVFGDLHSLEYAGLARAFPRIREQFGGRLQLVFKHRPSASFLSENAARAGACAHAQGRFWEFHDAVVTTPGLLDTARLKRVAGEAGLARAAFEACLDGDQFADLPMRAAAAAARIAVPDSPAVLVNGVLAPPPPVFLPAFEYLQRLIEEALAAARTPGPAGP